MSSSSRSSQNISQLSEKCLFSVENTGDDAQKKIKIFYAAPEDQSLMIVIFPLQDAPPLIEQLMEYSEKDKGWFFEFDRSTNTQERFIIIPNVTPDSPLKQSTPPVAEGFIALKNGKQQPVNKILGVPQGTLEKFLYTKQGEIKEQIDESKLGEGDRLITIYLPHGYDPTREHKYNLQITLDGDDVSMRLTGTKTILDNLIATKKIEPVVTVFIPPWNGAPDLEKYPTGDQAPPGYSKEMRNTQYGCNQAVAEDLAITLPNAIRKKFNNVTAERERIAITGCSMGGLQATFTALSYPTFGKVIAQSPAFWWSPPNTSGLFEGKQWLKDQVLNGVYDKNPPFKIWLEAGGMENGQEPYIETQNFPLRVPTNDFAAILRSKEYEVLNSTIPNGQHSMYQWRCSMAEAETIMHLRRPSFLELQAAHQHQETTPQEKQSIANSSMSETAQSKSVTAENTNTGSSPDQAPTAATPKL